MGEVSMSMRSKARLPLRKITARRQDFHATERYPQGCIVETLECGHEVLQGLHTPWPVSAARRRCIGCQKVKVER